MAMVNTAAVAGSTGFLGRHVVRTLISRGINVRALVRSREKASRVFEGVSGPGRLTIVPGDVLQARDVGELVAGADACVNLVGILREVRRQGVTFQRMHVDAVRGLVQACKDKGVARFVQISAIGVRPVSPCEYHTSKFEGEQAVRKSGLDWTVLRLGLVHGVESEIARMARGWCTGHAQPFCFLPYFERGTEDQRVPLGSVHRSAPLVSPVHVDDVCGAVVSALQRDAAIGEVYNLVGSETLSWPQMLAHMKNHIPGSLPGPRPFGVPAEAASIQAKIAGLLGLGQFLPFDEGIPLMAAEDSVADSTKAREDLDFAPHDFRSSFAAYAPGIV